MADFTEVMKTAGVKPRHIHRLVGVSRVTASNWIRGTTKPHSLVSHKAKVLYDAVALATEDGLLPVSDMLTAEEQSVKTMSVIKRYMDRLATLDSDPEN